MKIILEKNDLVVIEPKKVQKSEKSQLVRMGNRKTGMVESASSEYKLSVTVHTQIGSFQIAEDMTGLDKLKDIIVNLETSYFGSGYGLADRLAEHNAKIQISNAALKKDAIILLYELLENKKVVYKTHDFDDLIDHTHKDVKTV